MLGVSRLGVTGLEAAEAALSPLALVALTLKVYDNPLLRPVTVWLVAPLPALLSTPPAGVELTVYPVMAEPPLKPGALKLTVAWALPVTLLSVSCYLQTQKDCLIYTCLPKLHQHILIKKVLYQLSVGMFRQK